MQHIRLHFQKNDPIFYTLIEQFDIIPLKKSDDYFFFLCEAIVSQQLSIKASDTIFKRFLSLFPKQKIEPNLILELDHQTIRNVGISNPKVTYIKDLAQKVIDQTINIKKFDHLSDEEVISELVKVKGIGVWTAEMFLMSALGREDIFSYGDLGIRKAMQKLYKLKKEPTLKQAIKLSKKWSPYRTYACRLLWRSLA